MDIGAYFDLIVTFLQVTALLTLVLIFIFLASEKKTKV